MPKRSGAAPHTDHGRFFEHFTLGETLRHAVPLTLGHGDSVLYRALTGSRHALFSAAPFARANGFRDLPLDPLLAFHVVFGKTVPDISRNAVANLGYADGRFLSPVYAGDTLQAESEVIGLKQTSSGRTGIVWVRTTGFNQDREPVLTYVRWVLVNKRDLNAAAPEPCVPDLPEAVAPGALVPPAAYADWSASMTGSASVLSDYGIGDRIDHVDGMTLEEAEHQIATRLYQNTARVHFDALARRSGEGRDEQRLVYGGVVMSLARALSVNGLTNAAQILALNAGRHVAPVHAGDTLYAWSEVLDRAALSETVGALRLRLVATRNRPCDGFPLKTEAGGDDPAVVLDLDYWAAVPLQTTP